MEEEEETKIERGKIKGTSEQQQQRTKIVDTTKTPEIRERKCVFREEYLCCIL